MNANISIHLFSILLSTCLGVIDRYHFCKDYLYLGLSDYGTQSGKKGEGSRSCFLVLEALTLHWGLLQLSRLGQRDSAGETTEREMKAREEPHDSVLTLEKDQSPGSHIRHLDGEDNRARDLQRN